MPLTNPVQTQSNSPKQPLLPAWLWFIIALLWFGLLGYRALIHSDEGRYAEIAREMLQSGDWVTPRLDGLLYFEKPPLQYWITTLAYQLFGVNEFTARLWTGLAGFLTIITIGLTSKRLWGQRAGMMSALVAAGTTWIIANGHMLTLDMGLCFCLTVALSGFLLAANSEDAKAQQRWMIMAWAAMAGAVLSKGLIGLIIPGGAFTFYCIGTFRNQAVSRTQHWRLLRFVSSPIVFLALSAPWFVLVSMRNPDFAHFFFIHEHVERFLTHEAHREGPIWYFIPQVMGGLLPWTTLLPAAALAGLRADKAQRFNTSAFLLSWATFVFVFFSVSGSKLPSYILPLFPALAMLLGRYLANLNATHFRWHLIAPMVLWIILAIVGMQLPKHINDVPAADLLAFAKAIQIACVAYIAMTLLAFKLSKGDVVVPVALTAMASLVALNIAMVGHDGYAKQKTSRHIAPTLLPYLNADMPVYSVRTYDQTLPFYIGRTVLLVDYQDEFEFGEGEEPKKWIHDVDDFEAQWRLLPHAMAYMGADTFKMLQKDELPMKVVYQDSRRIAVVKP